MTKKQELGREGGVSFSWLAVSANMSKWLRDSRLQNTAPMGPDCKFYSKSLVSFLVIRSHCDFQSFKVELTQAPGTDFPHLPHSSSYDHHPITPVCFNLWREGEKAQRVLYTTGLGHFMKYNKISCAVEAGAFRRHWHPFHIGYNTQALFSV